MLYLLILSAVCCSFVTVSGTSDMGPGTYNVLFITKCEEDSHKFKFDVSQEKINRTHDGFNAYVLLEEDFTEYYGVRVDVCKYVDGGCKPFQVMSDDCFVNYVMKYAENNVKLALEMAGVDPPEFPIKAGEYEVEDYIFDYSELPSDGIYGEFAAKCFILEGTVEVGCLEIQLEFCEEEDD